MASLSWIPLLSEAQVDALAKRSHDVPCLIFKHSTRCEISSIAKYRLESDWAFGSEIEAYYLDLLLFRGASARVAEVFLVHHESPQVLLLSGGECVYDASHLDIQVAEIQEALDLEVLNK
jgi:bacillithiol system protein YtxJ